MLPEVGYQSWMYKERKKERKKCEGIIPLLSSIFCVGHIVCKLNRQVLKLISGSSSKKFATSVKIFLCVECRTTWRPHQILHLA
jgi:hypothetical protein